MIQVYVVKIGAAIVPVRAESRAKADEWVMWLKSSLCQICYPLLDMANTERADMMEKLKKSPVYKHNIKHLANKAANSLNAITEGCLVNCEVEQMHDFAAYFEAGIQQDVTNIRNAMSKYLNRNGVAYAPIISRMETVNVLLQFEVKCYDKVCEIIKHKIGGSSVKEVYGHMRAGGVLKEWNELGDALARINPYKGFVDLDKCKEAHEAASMLYHHAFEEELIKESLDKVEEEWGTK